jgi:hypothetical protein
MGTSASHSFASSMVTSHPAARRIASASPSSPAVLARVISWMTLRGMPWTGMVWPSTSTVAVVMANFGNGI